MSVAAIMLCVLCMHQMGGTAYRIPVSYKAEMMAGTTPCDKFQQMIQ